MLPLTLSLTASVGDALGLDRLVAHRLGNLAIAVATAVMVRWTVERLLRERMDAMDQATGHGIAWTAALLYLVHPVAGIGVNYLCSRDLLLMQALLWLGLVSILRASERPGWRDGLPALCVLAALCAKTNAVMAPALFGAFAWLGLGRPLRDRQLWTWVATSAAAAVAFLAYTNLALSFSDLAQTSVQRDPLDVVRTQAKLHLVHYGRNAVWPFEIRLLPNVELVTTWADPGVWASALIIVAACVYAWRQRGRKPLVSLAILAYFVSIAPTTSFVSMRQLAADYRPLPGLPWLCLLAGLLLWTRVSPRVRTSAVALLVTYAAGSSVLLNETWRTEESAWAQSLRHGGTPQAHVNYAYAVAGRDPDLAGVHYREALRRNPRNVFAHINLGMLDVHRGRLAAGVHRLDHARQLAPDWALTQQWFDRGCQQALASVSEASADDARAVEQTCRAATSRRSSRW